MTCAYDEHADRSTESGEAATTASTPSAVPWQQQVPDEPYDIALRMLDIIDRLSDKHAERAWDQLGDQGLRGYVFAAGLHRDLERAHSQAPTQDDTTAQAAAADEATDQTTGPAAGPIPRPSTVEHDDPLGLWDTWHLDPSFDPGPVEAEGIVEGIGEEMYALDDDPDEL